MSINRERIFNFAALTCLTTGKSIARVITKVNVEIRKRAMIILYSLSALSIKSST